MMVMQSSMRPKFMIVMVQMCFFGVCLKITQGRLSVSMRSLNVHSAGYRVAVFCAAALWDHAMRSCMQLQLLLSLVQIQSACIRLVILGARAAFKHEFNRPWMH